ncbi:alpha-1,2-fucosyltransferase [Edwardsiella tarda]|uniref:alpha-1,2-fucosyltransferase n=1 Tax=Edwardsiella tarda TaxID=636 RepID=UPI0024451F57|nr:alpha-1,2-fucosyltransferase [Edwardsiella tarda]WGE30133.1 alpha-1,2-fucosyltransferase [Edwardsiella tarda]
MNKYNVKIFLNGGLGNQLFQYAAGYSLAKIKAVNIELNIGSIVKEGAHSGFTLDKMSIPNCKISHDILPGFINKTIICNSKIVKIFGVKNELFWTSIYNTDKLKKELSLIGYWQNEKYFTTHRDELIEFFIPKEKNSIYKDNILNYKYKSVSIHFRRGDYITNKKAYDFHGVCSLDYYIKAVNEIKALYGEKVRFFIFSNDFNWVKSVINKLDISDYVFVMGTTPELDIYLMSLCDSHIIANSSFSWWGAWLSKKNGAVIAPDKWYTTPPKINADPCPEKWIRVER